MGLVRGSAQAGSGDVQPLNQLSGQQFSSLTEVIFQFLKEPKEVERFLAQLSDFAALNKISLGPLKNIVKSLLLVPTSALKRTLSAEQVRADLIALGLSEEKAGYFEEQWKENSPALLRLAVGQTLMVNQLIDMEWKFGVTAGSSELEKGGSIFLQVSPLEGGNFEQKPQGQGLDMDIDVWLEMGEGQCVFCSQQLKLVVKKGSQTEPVYLELTLPQFYSFLHEMERVKTSLECLS